MSITPRGDGVPGSSKEREESGRTGSSKSRALWACLIFVTICGRVAYLAHDRTYQSLGSAEVERAATSLAQDGTISRIFSDSTGKSAHVAPLYPLLLAGLYKIFGWDTMAGRMAQEVLTILATTTGIALLPVVARAGSLSVSAGWAAAFAMALLPLNLTVETSGIWEQPYAAVALLGMLLMFFRLSDERWRIGRSLLGCGALLGLAALLAPSLLPAGALMIVAELIRQRGSRGRVLVGSLVLGAVAGLIITPWAVRNYHALGALIPLRSNFGLELAIGNNSLATGRTYSNSPEGPENRVLEKIHPFRGGEAMSRLLSMGEAAYMRDMQHTATRWMRSNPEEALALTLTRSRLYWFPGADMWPPESPGNTLKSVVFRFFSALALANLVYLVVCGHPRAWLLGAAVIGPSLIYLVTHVNPRYAYPTFGLCSLLAFDFLASAWGALARRSFRTTSPERVASG